MTDAHEGKTVRCGGELATDEGDRSHCDKKLTFEEHGQFVSSGYPRDRFEGAGLRWDCPDCGNVLWTCPICTDDDDRSPAGWIDSENERGEFEQIPCHNCNAEEVARQRRQGRRV